MPVIIIFLAMFGIVSPRFLWKNFRYAILIIFLIAMVIAPTPDIPTLFVFALPMLVLYLIGIAGAWLVHPNRKKKKEATA
jgi:sec-independent protein translocase protein TatC